MRKSSKMLSLVIALIFLFSAVTPAFAASTRQERAGSTLLGLGVIEGYPDGGLGLERTITRAEMAVVIAKMSNLGGAADVLKSVPSKFSDVATNAWYTGFINLATQQSWVAGYPDGTFKPNAQVTNAEAITMVLNALGYGKGELPGAWPSNYIIKASQLDITKGISYSASAPALRGDVFSFAYEALGQPTVAWSKDKEAFEVVVNSELIKALTNSSAKITLNDAKEYIGTYSSVYKLADTFSALDYVGLEGTAYYNDDSEVVAFFTTNSYTSDFVEVTDSNTIEYVKDREYDLASGAVVVENNVNIGSTLSAAAVANTKALKDVKYVLNSADEITFISYSLYPAMDRYIVTSVDIDNEDKEVNAKLVDDTGTESTWTFSIDSTRASNKDTYMFSGSAAAWSEVKAGDVISFITDSYTPSGADVGGETAVYVSRNIVNGTVSAGTASSLTVNGTKYDFSKVANGTNFVLVSNDNGDVFAPATVFDADDIKAYIGESVSLHLDGDGKIAGIVSSVDAVADNYAIVTAAKINDPSAFGSRAKVELYILATDTKVIYESADKADAVSQNVYTNAAGAINELVKYRLNADGRVDTISELTASLESITLSSRDSDRGSFATASSSAVFGDSSTLVVSDYDGSPDMSNFSTFIKATTPGASYVYFKEIGGVKRAQVILASNSISSAVSDYAVYLDYSVIADGKVSIRFLEAAGVTSKVYKDATISTISSLAKGDIFSYEVSGNEISSVSEMSVTDREVLAVRVVNNDTYIDVSGVGLVRVDAETFYVDARDNDNIKAGALTDVRAGRYVDLIQVSGGSRDGVASIVVLRPAP